MSKKSQLKKRKTAAGMIKRRGTTHRVKFSEKRSMNPRGNYAPRATKKVQSNSAAGKPGNVVTLKSGQKYRIGEHGEWLKI